MKAASGSTGAGRRNFVAIQWGLVTPASAVDAPEAQAALEALYRIFLVAKEEASYPQVAESFGFRLASVKTKIH